MWQDWILFLVVVYLIAYIYFDHNPLAYWRLREKASEHVRLH